MGLFSKKSCSLCGNEVKLLSGKKLKDGHLCKDCKKQASVWFDFGGKTVEDIKTHLALRAENREKLDSFETTHAYGKFGCILIDNKHQQFVALPDTSDSLFGDTQLITDISQIKDKNPDVVQFSQVKSVEIKPRVTLQNNGSQDSGPKSYRYACNFAVEIETEHPYIRTMNIPLNSAALFITCSEPRQVTTYWDQLRAYLTGLKKQDYDIENNPDFRRVDRLEDIILNQFKLVPDYSFGFKVDQRRNWSDIKRYEAYILQAEQIKRILGK